MDKKVKNKIIHKRIYNIKNCPILFRRKKKPTYFSHSYKVYCNFYYIIIYALH